MDVAAPKVLPLQGAPAVRYVTVQLTRDGEQTPGLKIARFLNQALATQVAFVTADASTQMFLASAIDARWLVLAVDETPAARAAATFVQVDSDVTVTLDITSPVDKPEGYGYLAGEFPGGITTRLDIPVSATIKVLHTAVDGRTGKVAETVSNPDGTWAVHGLDPSKKFDVICSLPGFNDLILSKVSPTPY